MSVCGFGVWGSGFEVLRLRVKGLRFEDSSPAAPQTPGHSEKYEHSGFGVQGLRFQGLCFEVLEFRV